MKAESEGLQPPPVPALLPLKQEHTCATFCLIIHSSVGHGALFCTPCRTNHHSGAGQRQENNKVAAWKRARAPLGAPGAHAHAHAPDAHQNTHTLPAGLIAQKEKTTRTRLPGLNFEKHMGETAKRTHLPSIPIHKAESRFTSRPPRGRLTIG